MLLSKREHQILRCLVYGMSNKLIARELNIAETTVKVHIRGVLRKTRLSNRTQAAIWALNSNFSSSPPAGDGAEGGAAVEHAELELSGSARHWVEGSARSAPSDTKRAHRARSLGVLQADPASTGWRWTRQWDGSQCRS
jgi:DNA-binding CsgD family transcriptional regulator